MISHLSLLSVLQRVWGAMGVLLGVSALLLAAAAVAIGWASDNVLAAGFTAAAFVVCAVALLAAGIANAWAGAALERRVPAGRLGTLTLAVPNLFVLPFGTALAIYAFWVLLHNETRGVFEPDGPRP